MFEVIQEYYKMNLNVTMQHKSNFELKHANKFETLEVIQECYNMNLDAKMQKIQILHQQMQQI